MLKGARSLFNTASWIIFNANTQEFECERCGATRPFGGKHALSEWIRAMNDFEKLHNKYSCKQKQNEPKY
jgi:hypothetical protein